MGPLGKKAVFVACLLFLMFLGRLLFYVATMPARNALAHPTATDRTARETPFSR